MTISRLIVVLEEIQDEHGDCAVEVRNSDGDYDFIELVQYNEGSESIPTVLLDA